MNAVTASYSSNRGVLLENLVFWELYRRYGSIYTQNIFYYKDAGSESDFVIKTNDERLIPFQVCWSISDNETRKREIKGLINAARYCDSRIGWIITNDEKEELDAEGIRVYIIPAREWAVTPDKLS